MGRLFNGWTLAGLAAGLLLAGGCGGSSNSSGSFPPDAVPASPTQRFALPKAPDTQRCVVAPELEKVIGITSVSLTNPPGGYLKIQVNFKNLTDAPQKFRYRIDWFDSDGARLPVSGDKFTLWTLVPHEISYIGATAPAPTAADFGIAFVPDIN